MLTTTCLAGVVTPSSLGLGDPANSFNDNAGALTRDFWNLND
jgi:hypothetical protein